MARNDPNDITQFKKPARTGVLDDAADASKSIVPSAPAAKAEPMTKNVGSKKTTKKKQQSALRTEKITIYLTESEKTHVVNEAGLVALNKYLIMKMQEAGILPTNSKG